MSPAATLHPALEVVAPTEQRRRLARFGGSAELRVTPPAGFEDEAARRIDAASALLAAVDAHLSRFDPTSELSRLNRSTDRSVPATALMRRFVQALIWAGERSGGLVDGTCLDAVERAGYGAHLPVEAIEAGRASWSAPSPAPRPAPGGASWRDVAIRGDAVIRPPGLRLDSGGIGKGLAADLAASALRGSRAWMVDCGGDLRIGGTDGRPRTVSILDPIDRTSVIHQLRVTRGAVATSGVTRRAWLDPSGSPQHHLIDPRTGRPAATGVMQVTALAPTGVEAEVLAKLALLSGPQRAADELIHGGVIVNDLGVMQVVPAGGLKAAA